MRYIKIFEEYSKPYQSFNGYDFIIGAELVRFSESKVRDIKSMISEAGLYSKVVAPAYICIYDKLDGKHLLSINIDSDDWIYAFITDEDNQDCYKCDDVYGLKELLKDKEIIK